MALDEHNVIKMCVAINPNTSPETLKLLGTAQYNFGIKYFIAHNKNTPKEVRESLISKLPQNTFAIKPDRRMLLDYYEYD